MDFHPKQVVWAKVKGYPWWPAQINKLPQNDEGNFKVLFFAQETYALLEPKFVQKFSNNYQQYSKTKAKKFARALQLANIAAKRQSCESKNKKASNSRKKVIKKEEPQLQNHSQQYSLGVLSIDSKKQNENSSSINQSEMNAQNLIEQVDRKKVEKIQNELSDIITQFQTNRVKQWKYGKYFETFRKQYALNSQQLLHSNLTRKIRFIIENMRRLKFNSQDIEKLQQLSTALKLKVLDYLTDTTYYDQHIKLIDRSKLNKAETQNQIVRIMRKKYDGQIKRQFISILALHVGKQVGTKSKFKYKQLISDLKDGKYDNDIKHINSKAATLRLGEQLVNRYRD